MWSSVELLRKELTHIPAAFHDDRATPKAAISNHLNTIDRKAELRQDELKLAAVCGMAVTFAWVNRRTPWEVGIILWAVATATMAQEPCAASRC